MNKYLFKNEEIYKAFIDKRMYIVIVLFSFVGVILTSPRIFQNILYLIFNQSEQLHSMSEWYDLFKDIYRFDILILTMILFPFGFSLYEEKKRNLNTIQCIRQPYSEYIKKKIIATALASGFIYLSFSILSALIFIGIEYIQNGFIIERFDGRIYWIYPLAHQKNEFILFDLLSSSKIISIGLFIFVIKAMAYGAFSACISLYVKFDKYFVVLVPYFMVLVVKVISKLIQLFTFEYLEYMSPIKKLFLFPNYFFSLDLCFVAQGMFAIIPHIIGIFILLLLTVILYKIKNKEELI